MLERRQKVQRANKASRLHALQPYGEMIRERRWKQVNLEEHGIKGVVGKEMEGDAWKSLT